MVIDDNKGTAVSMILTYHAIYVVNTVQVCVASVIIDCAQGMLSNSHDHIRSFVLDGAMIYRADDAVSLFCRGTVASDSTPRSLSGRTINLDHP
jgi:hypothetical protein